MRNKVTRTVTSVALVTTALVVDTGVDPTAAVHAATPPPLFDCSGANCPPGPYPNVRAGFPGAERDDTVNVFVGGDMAITQAVAESEGLNVVMGGLEMDKTPGLPIGAGNVSSSVFDVGQVGAGSLVAPNDGANFLLVGGDVSVTAGQRLIVGANVDSVGEYAGTSTGNVDIGPSGSWTQNDDAVTAYADVAPALTALSTCLASAVPTGTVRSGETWQFAGDGSSAVQVFNVTQPGGLESDFGGNSGINITGVPATSTVIINILGTGTVDIRTYTGGFFSVVDAFREQLIWNVPNADQVNFHGSAQFQGSVLVGNPASTASVRYPGMNGRFYTTGDLDFDHPSSGAEFHAYPFRGDFPDGCGLTTPPPVDDTFDLALVKTIAAVNGPLLSDAGNGTVTFDLTVTNQDAAVRRVEITDYLGIGADIDFEYAVADQSTADVVASGGDRFTVNWDATDPVVTVSAVDPTDELDDGETLTVPITLRVAAGFDPSIDGSFDGAAEISAFDDDDDATNPPPIDADSTPDDTDESNAGETVGASLRDDEIGEDDASGGDEDDHDIASLPWWDLALITARNANTDYQLDTSGPTTTATFDIVVANQGRTVATGIGVIGSLPTGTAFASDDGSTTTGDAVASLQSTSATNVEWTIDRLDPGEQITITFTVEVTDDTIGTYEHLAEITTFADVDGNPVGGGVGDPFDIDSTPDAVPDDQIFDDPTDPDNPRNSHNLVDYDADGDGDVNEPATDPVTGDEDDHGREVVVIVAPPAEFDLALAQRFASASTPLVQPGTSLNWDITITNQGDAVQTIEITDYPTFDEGDPTPSDEAATLVAVSDAVAVDDDGTQYDVVTAGNTITATARGNGVLDRGESVTVRATTIVGTGWDGSSIVNWAEISRFDDDLDASNGDSAQAGTGTQLVDVDSTPDATPDNDNRPSAPGDPTDDEVGQDAKNAGGDEDDHDIAALPVYDLSLITTRGGSQPFAVETDATEVTFSITVKNQGDQVANDIGVVDYTPADTAYLDASNTANDAANPAVTYEGAGGDGNPTFTIDTLAPGAQTTFDVTFDITASADEFVNGAEIVDFDGDPAVPASLWVDIDSTPDSADTDVIDESSGVDPAGNDDRNSHNDIDRDRDGDGNAVPPRRPDEDDHDREVVVVEAVYDLALITQLDEANLPATIGPGTVVPWTATITNQSDPVRRVVVAAYPLYGNGLAGGIAVETGPFVDSDGGTWIVVDTTADPVAPSYELHAAAGVSLDLGESLALPLRTTVAPDWDGSPLVMWAEIARFDDDLIGSNGDSAAAGTGGQLVDIDSTPDTDPANDNQPAVPGAPTDDEIGQDAKNGGGDEDDHDVAGLPIYDLALIVTRSPGQQFLLDADSTSVDFDITVKNQGTATALDVDVNAALPVGTVLGDNVANAAAAPGVTYGPGASFVLDRLDPGTTVTFSVTVDLVDTSVPDYLLVAEIGGFAGEAGVPPALVVDIDSTPDDDANGGAVDPIDTSPGVDPDGNDDRNSHNDIDNDRDASGAPIVPAVADEDDHDQELVVLPFDLAVRTTLAGAPPEPLQNGAEIPFTISVFNQGRDVDGIDITDHLGPNFTFVASDNPAGVVTTADGASISYDWGSADADAGTTVTALLAGALAAGDRVDIPLVLTAQIADGGEQLETWAEISRFDDGDGATGDSATGALADVDSTPDGDNFTGPGEDPDADSDDDEIDEDGSAGNDEDDHDGARIQWFDLSLIVERSAGQAYVLDPSTGTVTVDWDITVANQAPNDAFGIEVIKRLPVGMAYESLVGVVAGSAPVSARAPAGDEQRFDIAVLRAGDAVTFTVRTSLPITPATPGRFVTDAEIVAFSGIFDNDGDGVVSMLPVPVTDVDSTPDASTGDPFDPGDPTDAIDAANGVLDPADGHNDIDVDRLRDGINNFDGLDEDDADTEAVVMVADLALQHRFVTLSDPVAPDGTATFHIEIFNQGLATVDVVEITDFLQTGLTFDVARNPDGDTLPSTGQPWLLGGRAFTTPVAAPTVTWDATATATVTGAIAPGESVVVPVVLSIEPDAPVATLRNTAEISDFDVDGDLDGPAPIDLDSTPDAVDDDVQPAAVGAPTDDAIDGRPGGVIDDEDDHDIAGVPVYDVALVIDRADDQPYVVDAADPVRWVVTVRNQGSQAITDVTVNVEQPAAAGVIAISDVTDAGLPVGVTRVVDDFVIDELQPSESVTFTIVTTIDQLGPDGRVVLVAEVASFADASGSVSGTAGGPSDVDSTPDGDISDDPLLRDVPGEPDPVDSHNDVDYDPDGDGDLNEPTPGDEDDHDAAAVLGEFDLALRATLPDDPNVEADVDIAVAVEVFNQGSVAATDIDIVAALPDGTTVSDGDDNGWAGTNGPVRNSVDGPIAPGQSVVLDLVVRVDNRLGERVIAAEIVSARDALGAPRDDVDSTPDDDSDGGAADALVDDEIDSRPGAAVDDEDDHDIVVVEIAPASLGDRVWLDVNRDGLQSPDEPGVENVAIDLLDAAGDTIDSTVSDADGAYEFSGLLPGRYSLRFDRATLPDQHQFTIRDAGPADDADSDVDLVTGLTPAADLRAGDADTTFDAGVLLPEFDLEATKESESTDAQFRTVVWNVEASNVGPGVAIGPITIVDEIPEGQSFVGVRDMDADCSVDRQTVECVFDQDLDAGETLTGKIITRVAIGNDTVFNTVTVRSRYSRLGQTGGGPDDVTASVTFAEPDPDTPPATDPPMDPVPVVPDPPAPPPGAPDGPLPTTGADAGAFGVVRAALLIVVSGLALALLASSPRRGIRSASSGRHRRVGRRR